MQEPSEVISDAELLSQYASNRSHLAFEQIVRRHIDMVYAAAKRSVRDVHLADDVTQAVFVVLAKKAPRLGSSVSLAGWLYRTARFLSRDAIKMKQRREFHERVAATLAPTQVESKELWTSMSPVIDAAIEQLNERERDVLLLRFFEGLGVSETARVLNLPPNTVSKRIERGLEKLRTYLEDRGINASSGVLGAAMLGGAEHARPELVGTVTSQVASASVQALAGGAMKMSLVPLKVAAVLLGAVVGTVAVAQLNNDAPTAQQPTANAPANVPATQPQVPLTDFPTGKPFRLGPVHELKMTGWNDLFDQPLVIDFDAQRVMNLLEATRVFGLGITHSERGQSHWYTTEGAQADAYIGESIIPARSPTVTDTGIRAIGEAIRIANEDNRVFYVYGIGNVTQQINDARWDTLEAEIASGRKIAFEPARSNPGFRYVDPATGKEDRSHAPATFLFRTREGGAGILQTLSTDKMMRTVHFRYRMVEPHPANHQPKEPAKLPPTAAFGESKEVTLEPRDLDRKCAIDFETGKVLTPDQDDLNHLSGNKDAWIDTYGGDAVTSLFFQSAKLAGLKFHGAVTLAVTSEAYDSMDPALAKFALDRYEAKAESFVIIQGTGHNQGTALFRTRDGTYGITQIKSTTDSPATLTFRYKVIGK